MHQKSRFATGFLSIAALAASLAAAAQTRISLDSDNPSVNWKLRPQDDIGRDSTKIFSESYNTTGWVNALVPGAVFASYVAAGIEQDPNWADNIYRVDKKKYDRNFWYRTEFATPAEKSEKIWLNFEGVNRKAEIFLNGIRLGGLDGFMQRGKFDITGIARTSGKNILAVLVQWPTRPVANYAMPAYMSSDSWDWMPAVPGLLQGITDDVYLTTTGGVTIADPWIRTDVSADKSKAYLWLNANLTNNTVKEQDGEFTAIINPGNIKLTRKLKLQPGQSVSLSFDSTRYKSEMVLRNPRLWWPNGYGEPNLYTLDLAYTANGQASDSRQIKFGVKKYSYDTLGGVLHISVNGEKIFVKGGNWGMSEYLLRCRGAEYDLKLRLHKEMNYNMIRNWIGSVTDEEFYDACDKYGVMVWDDFWLNSHPNLPNDVLSFNANAVEKIKRLRNHPSIAMWCGDNESYPQPPLDGWLREDVKTFDAGDRQYHSNSHSDNLTGSGPWSNFHPNWYFTRYPGGFGGDKGWGFRTEIGTAVFTTFESFKKFMPQSSWWPRNEMWNKHFFGASAANGGPDRYETTLNGSYGKATGIEDWCRKAQLVNLETNKALYEGWQHHMWDDASGVMTWMSQSAYPSFVWQTYDYYYDLNGAYWGVKKACEPVHIQWSYADNSVKVSNTTLKTLNNLTAEAVVYNIDGAPVAKYGKKTSVNAAANAATSCFTLNFSTDNLAAGKKATASSTSQDAGDAGAATDGSGGSRWSSLYNDDQWIYVDMGAPVEIAEVVLNWEGAHARHYRLQVSDDAQTWKDVYENADSRGGPEIIRLTPVTTRYIKMKGIKRATQWGYSLFEFEAYGRKKARPDLTSTHFIRLFLRDEKGVLVSDNFYWRSAGPPDYTLLNTMPKASLGVTSRLVKEGGKDIILATVKNTGRGIAFATHVQAYRVSDNERILPAIANDDYFTLMQGESKAVKIEFDESLLKDGKYRLSAEPYNNK